MIPNTDEFGERNDTSITIELIFAQYRLSRIEGVVTKNVFRVIWFAFSVYLSSTTMQVDGAERPLFLFFELFSLTLVAFLLYFTSRSAKNYIVRQSNNLRELLISSDRKLKDHYVREFHKSEIIEEHYAARRLLGREDILWLCAVTFILYLRVASIVFAQ